MREMRFKLAPGSQVREEDFGLLFYTMEGPRLYFISSGDLIGTDFFEGVMSMDQYIIRRFGQDSDKRTGIRGLKDSLDILTEKGVIFEC